jgi:hypothetical protein
MNKARQRLFFAAIVQTHFAIASRSAAPIAAARQWQQGGSIADFLRAALDRFLAAVLAREHSVPANQPVRLSLRPSSCFIGRQGIRRCSNER